MSRTARGTTSRRRQTNPHPSPSPSTTGSSKTAAKARPGGSSAGQARGGGQTNSPRTHPRQGDGSNCMSLARHMHRLARRRASTLRARPTIVSELHGPGHAARTVPPPMLSRRTCRLPCSSTCTVCSRATTLPSLSSSTCWRKGGTRARATTRSAPSTSRSPAGSSCPPALGDLGHRSPAMSELLSNLMHAARPATVPSAGLNDNSVRAALETMIGDVYYHPIGTYGGPVDLHLHQVRQAIEAAGRGGRGHEYGQALQPHAAPQDAINLHDLLQQLHDMPAACDRHGLARRASVARGHRGSAAR